jgi:hypothetical protein
MCNLEGEEEEHKTSIHSHRHKKTNTQTPFTVAAGNWSLLALSKPPNVSARFGSVGEM